MTSSTRDLHRLARLHGVQTSYYDVGRQRRSASSESLLAVLHALRAGSRSFADVPEALQQAQQRLLSRGLEPVVVAWDGEAVEVELRLPADRAAGSLAWQLQLETGEGRRGESRLDRLPQSPQSDGKAGAGEDHHLQTRRLPLPGDLPGGYHRLILETGDKRFESLVVSAPRRAWSPERNSRQARSWGGFLPLYALQSERSWGAGDFSDLQALAEWIGSLGGGIVATLPLLAAFLEQQSDPSPYAPVSRMFWNAFYIDVTRVPELNQSPEARKLLESADVKEEIAALQALDSVDYRRQMALKRRILELLAESLFARRSSRFVEFQHFAQAHPLLEDYARFRAVHERRGEAWREWPSRLRDGEFQPEDYDDRARRYHLYAQWVASQQLQALSGAAEEAGSGLYLDLPLGVRPDGFDVWRHQDIFAANATAGAPPDAVFTKGQNWGFSPLHPEAVREQNYQHVRDYLHHHLKFARLLRLDHVMALHRLFWIPEGMPPSQGVYVQYRAEEMYAILSLESHRHRVGIVGENLGTVPSSVNRAMNRHRIRRMYVVQYEFQTDPNEVLGRVPRGSAASLNTHDMPQFAAWWEGDDIPDRLELGLLDEAGAEAETRSRSTLKRNLANWLRKAGWLETDEVNAEPVMRACLKYLAAGPAGVALVNLEDLWQERRPQNTPGTSDERLNWRRKARYRFEELCQLPEVVEALADVDRLRKTGSHTKSKETTTK